MESNAFTAGPRKAVQGPARPARERRSSRTSRRRRSTARRDGDSRPRPQPVRLSWEHADASPSGPPAATAQGRGWLAAERPGAQPRVLVIVGGIRHGRPVVERSRHALAGPPGADHTAGAGARGAPLDPRPSRPHPQTRRRPRRRRLRLRAHRRDPAGLRPRPVRDAGDSNDRPRRFHRQPPAAAAQERLQQSRLRQRAPGAPAGSRRLLQRRAGRARARPDPQVPGPRLRHRRRHQLHARRRHDVRLPRGGVFAAALRARPPARRPREAPPAALEPARPEGRRRRELRRVAHGPVVPDGAQRGPLDAAGRPPAVAQDRGAPAHAAARGADGVAARGRGRV
mmetsp:Transcript_8373/g.26132  ORF Transcript_8373/g.26132 Transcript_8373/m.26132 type:complete len:341 (+) Transcript_8373:402-1424(+)